VKSFIILCLWCYFVPQLSSAAALMAQDEISTHEGTRKFYETGVEAKRLSDKGGRFERARVESILKRFLPKSPATVADVGGGMGVYAFLLADEGYSVSLIDPVPSQIEVAKDIDQKREKGHLQACTVGDARKIPLEDASMDVVLFFGPLYHLDHPDRLIALQEAYRILKPGGLLLAQAVSKYTVLINAFFDEKIGSPAVEKMIAESLTDSRFEYRQAVFYCHTPEEMKAEIEQTGFSHIQVLAVEGLGKWVTPKYWENEELRNKVLAYVAQTESDPSFLGATSHIMAIAQKEKK